MTTESKCRNCRRSRYINEDGQTTLTYLCGSFDLHGKHHRSPACRVICELDARIAELESDNHKIRGELYETEQARQIACDSHISLIEETERLRRRISFVDRMLVDKAQ